MTMKPTERPEITIRVTKTEYELIRNALGTVVTDYDTFHPFPWVRDSGRLLERLPPHGPQDPAVETTVVKHRVLTPVETALQAVYETGDWGNTNCERGR